MGDLRRTDLGWTLFLYPRTSDGRIKADAVRRPVDIRTEAALRELAARIYDFKLQKEQAKEFYVELPIAIVASGSYHDLGAFISGMAGLPRIVTLHDFQLASNKTNPNNLDMKILAKTYRYKDETVAR